MAVNTGPSATNWALVLFTVQDHHPARCASSLLLSLHLLCCDLGCEFFSATQVPFWKQQASQRQDGLVVWDYHVVVLEVNHHQELQQQQQQHQQQAQQLHQPAALFWDLDTVLPFPCSFQEYAQQALQADSIVLARQYQR
jgi:hypothetical protein